MASHMGVQSFATSRNAKVEIFVNFVLDEYCKKLVSDGITTEYTLESQKHYISDIASDVWDHYVSFQDNRNSKKVELWCQTTCYKGNKTGKPESNKTYEVRETLVEAISFRKHVISSPDIIRTIHFTVGSKKYTYDWFAPVKEATFDLSLYLEIDGEDILNKIVEVFEGVVAEFQVKKKLSKEVKDKTSTGCVASDCINALYTWHTNMDMPLQTLANKQYMLIEQYIKQHDKEINTALKNSINAGSDIKKRCNDLVHGGVETDPYIMQTVDLLLEKNPFIKNAKKVLSNWSEFSKDVKEISRNSNNLPEFVSNLWVSDCGLKLVVRRLLLRIGSDDAINYVQDVNIDGVTEHNLYTGVHKGERLGEIVSYVLKVLPYTTIIELYDSLTSKSSKKLLQSSVWFEAKNGTDLKPSFDYIELVLRSKGFSIERATTLDDKPVGYHSQLAGDIGKVNPYTNLKVILNNKGNVIAYLKGKYFRPPEFPRRCKEEAYVSLTLMNEYVNGKFKERFNIPIIMFVDMPEEFSPPEYALRRLMSFGWSVVFNVNEIVTLLERNE